MSSVRFRLVCVAAGAALFAGCATKAPPIPRETVSALKRVAVISKTYPTFTRRYVGVTVFGNEREERNISAWNLDQEYGRQIGSLLETTFKLQVVSAAYSQAEFGHALDPKGPWDAPAYWGPNWRAIELAAKKHCDENSLDALIVVASTKSGDVFAGTNQMVSGAGSYVRGRIRGLPWST